MRKYFSHVLQAADNTPVSRNRAVDFWRVVAILTVVCGHWFAASIWKQPDGELVLMNSLQWIPYAAWVTWLVQVMPIFFFVGGYANAMSLKKTVTGSQQRRDWISTRVRRVYTPVVPLLVVWTVLILALTPFLPADTIYAGAMSATVPLWFMAVYLLVIATAPITFKWWLTYRWWSMLFFLIPVIGIDVAHFRYDVPGIGWFNFFFVWAAVHQIGYWWATRDSKSASASTLAGWGIFTTATLILVGITWSGLYPVAMVGIPGAEVTNMSPPTFAIFVLGVAQAGIIWGTLKVIQRWTQKRKVWIFVISVSGVIMTIYLWHLSAMTLVAAAGISLFDGAMFHVEPGTSLWWATRPLWILLLSGVTLALLLIFARFEWAINKKPTPKHRIWIMLGLLLSAGAAGAVAWWGLVTPESTINFIIPIMAIVGAGIMGAYPTRNAFMSSKSKTESVEKLKPESDH